MSRREARGNRGREENGGEKQDKGTDGEIRNKKGGGTSRDMQGGGTKEGRERMSEGARARNDRCTKVAKVQLPHKHACPKKCQLHNTHGTHTTCWLRVL